MASVIGNASQTTSVTRVSEGDQIQLRTDRSGVLITQDWILSLVAEGVVHGVNTGTGTSPDTFNATYADAQQDLYLYVPSGTVIIPLYIGVQFEDTGTAQVMDVLAGYSSNGDSDATGDALVIYNYRTLASPSSSVTATAVVTSTGSTHLGGTDFLEFWRPYAGFAEDAFNGSTAPTMGGQYSVAGAHWSARDFVAPIVGSAGTDCALSLFASAQAGLGFATIVWAELPASAFA